MHVLHQAGDTRIPACHQHAVPTYRKNGAFRGGKEPTLPLDLLLNSALSVRSEKH